MDIYSLQDHLFHDISNRVYRDINEYNPLNISHPLTDHYLDQDALSAVEPVQEADSLNLLLTQDCAGFNLGSFLLRRSPSTSSLDIWWDPVLYEQSTWSGSTKEQDALEQLYESHPWIRQHTGFFPDTINAFPPGACGDESGQNNTRHHYNGNEETLSSTWPGVSGAGTAARMYHYREFSYWLNRNVWRGSEGASRRRGSRLRAIASSCDRGKCLSYCLE